MVAAAYVILVALGVAVGHGTVLAIGVKLLAIAAMLMTIVLAGLVTRAELAAAISRTRRLVTRSTH